MCVCIHNINNIIINLQYEKIILFIIKNSFFINYFFGSFYICYLVLNDDIDKIVKNFLPLFLKLICPYGKNIHMRQI